MEKLPEEKNQPDVIEVEHNEVSVVTSLCMRCYKQGETKLLLTKIPFFQDILVMSFDCPHCGYKNNELQTVAPLKDKGVKYTLKISKPADLQRMVVAGFKSLIYIPEIDFEVPSIKTGTISTVEGMIRSFREDLSLDQPERKEVQPEVYAKIEEVIKSLKHFERGEIIPFHFIIDDASGNSFISNPYAPL